MQPFRFRLQRVLDWQQKVCQIEEEKLSRAISEAAEIEHRLSRLAANRAAVEQEFVTRSGFAPADLKALAEFRRKATTDRRALEGELAKRRSAVTAQREQLMRERRRLRAFEKLRERARAEYTVAAEREWEALSLESYLANF